MPAHIISVISFIKKKFRNSAVRSLPGYLQLASNNSSQIDDTLGVAPFIVVPHHNLDHVLAKELLNSSKLRKTALVNNPKKWKRNGLSPEEDEREDHGVPTHPPPGGSWGNHKKERPKNRHALSRRVYPTPPPLPKRAQLTSEKTFFEFGTVLKATTKIPKTKRSPAENGPPLKFSSSRPMKWTGASFPGGSLKKPIPSLLEDNHSLSKKTDTSPFQGHDAHTRHCQNLKKNQGDAF